jgi:flagellin
MFSVVTNNNAMAALQSLNSTQKSMSTTQNRITSGLRVASASDNASTFSIAQGMRGDIAGLKAASQSISLGKSTLGVALSAAEQISDKLNELKGKITEGQQQNVDLAKIQQDMDNIVQSINDIGAAAQFNGVNLLNNSAANGLDVLSGLNRTSATSETISSFNVAAQDLRTSTLGIASLSVTGNTSVNFAQSNGLAFAEGDTISLTVTNAGGAAINYTFEINDGGGNALTTATTTTTDPNAAAGTVAIAVVSDTATDTPQQTLGKLYTAMRDAGFTVTNNEDGSFDVSSGGVMTGATQTIAAGGLTAGAIGTAASVAFTAVNNAIDTVNGAVSSLGTSSNSLDASAKFVSSLTDALTEGVGLLVDADLAEESANLQALQTRQQLGIQALSIANQQPGSVLSLFRG